MKAKIITIHDCCEKVIAEYSPVEWLIANKALKKFRADEFLSLADREKALDMLETEIEVEEQTGENNATLDKCNRTN